MTSSYVTSKKIKVKGQNFVFCPFFKRMRIEMEEKKIRLDEQSLAYKKGLKWHAVSYEDIVNAYLRIEEVNGRLCCGVASFDMHFLMLKTKSDELIKIEISSKDIVKQILDELTQKNDKIVIGFNKDK